MILPRALNYADQFQTATMTEVFPLVRSGGQVFGGGAGGGDDSDPPKRPEGDPSKKKAPEYKMSETEKEMRRLEEAIAKFMQKGHKVKFSKMNRANLEILLQAIDVNPLRLVSQLIKKNARLEAWKDFNVAGSSHRLVREPEFRNPQDVFNPNGGENYLLSILISAAAGSDKWDSQPCTRCRNGHGKFKHCITFPGLLNGACINCGYDNHYENCTFVNNPPVTDEAMARQLASQLQVSPVGSASRSRSSSQSVSGAAAALAGAMGSPMQISGGSNRGQAASSQPQQPGWGFVRRDNRQTDVARETAPIGASSDEATGVTQLLLNINTAQQH